MRHPSLDDPKRILAALTTLRLAVAGLMFIHGAYRALSGGTVGFTSFLSSLHLPLPHVAAWAITLSELFFSVLMALNIKTRYACAVISFILLMGIITVHAREGWFVVGGGRNGVEFSLLLIVSLFAIFLTHGEASHESA